MFQFVLPFIPMFVCLFWLVVLLLDGQKSVSKLFLAFFMGVCVVNYFVHTLYFNHQYRIYALFDSVWVFTSLGVYPLCYLYIRLLTVDTKINWRWGWILLPSVVLAVFSAVVYLLMPPSETDIFIQNVMYHKSGYPTPYPLPVRLLIFRQTLFKIIYVSQVYFGLKHIVQYNSEIRKFYSNIDKKDLSPIRTLLWLFVFTSLASLLASIAGKSFFVDSTWLLVVPMLVFACLLFGIGYVGCKQDFTIKYFKQDIDNAEAKRKTECPDTAADPKSNEQMLKKILYLLENERIFTNPDLRITDISEKLNTNRTYISRLVNEELRTNFSEFINGYRIMYAKELLKDLANADFGLSQIGEMAGFSSDSSFYRIFKNREGVSPGDFRKKWKQS